MSYQQASQAIQSGQFEQAIALLQPLIQANPAQPNLWYAKALALLSLERIEDAIKAVEWALCLDPTLAPAHRLLGQARHAQGDSPKAIAAYKEAMRFYLKQQDKANAQSCLRCIQAIQPQPQPQSKPAPTPPARPQTPPAQPPMQPMVSPQDYIAVAIAKAQRGRYSEAIQDLDWLLHLEPNNVEALVQRGLFYAKRQNHEAAVRDMARAIQLSPDDPGLRLQWSDLRLQVGDAQGAIADLSALLQSPVQNQGCDPAKVYLLRGRAHHQLKDFENAFKDFSNALGLNPQDAEGYQLRGKVYEATADLEEALSNYRRAASLHLEQGNWSAHQQMQQHIKALEAKLQIEKDEAARIIRVPIKTFVGRTPIIEVVFNGRYPCDMALDTGAGITSLTERMAQMLNVIPAGMRRFCLADGRIIEAAVGFVHSLTIQRAEATNLEVAILPGSIEGLLGQNYLWRYDVRILRTEVELYLR